MTDRPIVQFDAAKAARLKAAYKKALAAGDTSFVFEEREYVTGYAKYLIEYLDSTLGKKK